MVGYQCFSDIYFIKILATNWVGFFKYPWIQLGRLISVGASNFLIHLIRAKKGSLLQIISSIWRKFANALPVQVSVS